MIVARAAMAAVTTAVVAAGCGGGAGSGEGQPPAVRCEAETREYLDTMRALALKILYIEGVYVEYRRRVETIQAARDALAVDGLPAACRTRVVAVADRARDQYVAALEHWTTCDAKRGGCDNATVEPRLQRYWRRADEIRQEAEQNVSALLEAEERERGYGSTTN